VELQRHDGARVFRMLMSADTQSMTARYLAAVGCDEGLVVPLLIAWAAESLTQNALLHGHGVSGTNLAARRVLASLLFLALNRAGDRS
jgi:hypothetical protein